MSVPDTTVDSEVYQYRVDELPFIPMFETTQKLSNIILKLYLICEKYGLEKGSKSVYSKIYAALMRGISFSPRGIANDERATQYKKVGYLGSKSECFSERKLAIFNLLDNLLHSELLTLEAYYELVSLFDKLTPVPDNHGGASESSSSPLPEQ